MALGEKLMREPVKKGLFFGLTSATITTLGLIVGLHSFVGSQLIIIGGIITIAIADAFSDALGIHISEEAEQLHTSREIWEATLYAFFAKFLFALTFIIPVLILDFSTAFIVILGWGFLILAVLSYFVAKHQQGHPWKVIAEHLIIAFIVVNITHFLGDWIATIFN
jgi:VIT1/CCC1 family predicted Fe2+/Mn2+ transporter